MACGVTIDYVKSKLPENRKEDSNLVNAIVGLFDDETKIISVNIGEKEIEIIKLSNGSLINLETLNSNIEILLDKEKDKDKDKDIDVTRIVKRAYNSLFSNTITKEEKEELEKFIKQNGSYTSFNYAINKIKNKFYNETNFFVLDREDKNFINGVFSFNSFVRKLSTFEKYYQEYLQNKDEDAKYTNIKGVFVKDNVIDVSSLSDKNSKKLIFNIQMGMLYDAHKRAIAMNKPSPLSAFYKYFLNEIERPDIYEKEKSVNEVRKVDEHALDKGDIEERSDVLEDMYKEEMGRTTSQEVKNHIGNIPVINSPTIIRVNDSNDNTVTHQIQVTSKDRNTGNYENYDEKYMHHILIETYKKANEQYISGEFASFRDALLYNLLYDDNGNLNDMAIKKNKAKLSFALRFFAEATNSLDIVKIETAKIIDDKKYNKIITIKLLDDDLYLQPLKANSHIADEVGFTEDEQDRKLYFNYYNVINAINGYFLSTNKSNYVRIDLSEGSKKVDIERAEYTTDVASQEPHRVIQNFFFKSDKQDEFRNPEKRKKLLGNKDITDILKVLPDIYIDTEEFIQKLIDKGLISEELQKLGTDILVKELEAYINETDFNNVIAKDKHIRAKQIVSAFANMMLSELNVSIESVTEISEEENNEKKREFVYPFSALLFSREDIEKAKVKANLSNNVADYAIFYDVIKTFLGNANNYFSDTYAFSTDENLVVSFVGLKGKDATKNFKDDKLYKPRISLHKTLNGNGYVLLDGTESIDKSFATILYPKNEYKMQTIPTERGNVPIFNLSSLIENLEWVDEVFPYLPYKKYYRVLEITTGKKDEAKSYKELTPKDRFLTMLILFGSGYSFAFTPANKSINYVQEVEKLKTDEAIERLQKLQTFYFGHTYYAYTGKRFTKKTIKDNDIEEIKEVIDKRIEEINKDIIKIGDKYEAKKRLYTNYGLLENIDYEFVETSINGKTTYSIKFPEALKLYTTSEALELENTFKKLYDEALKLKNRFEELSAKGESLNEIEKLELASVKAQLENTKAGLASVIEKQKINHFAKTENWFKRYEKAFAEKLDELVDKFLTAEERKALTFEILNAKGMAIGDYVASYEEMATTFHSPFDTKTKTMTDSVKLFKYIIVRQMPHTVGDPYYSVPTPVVVSEEPTYSKEAILDENGSNQYLEIQKIINENSDKGKSSVRDGTIFISPFFSKILRVTHRINAEGIAKLGISAITNRGTNFFGKGATITLSRTLMEGDFSGKMQELEDRMLGKTLSAKLKEMQEKKREEVSKELAETETDLSQKVNRRNELIEKEKNNQIEEEEKKELETINAELLSTIENNDSFISLMNRYQKGEITEEQLNETKNTILEDIVKKIQATITRKRNEIEKKYDNYIRNQEDYDELVKWYLSTKEELNKLIRNNDEIGKMLSEHMKSLYANNNQRQYKNRYDDIMSSEDISKDIKDFITALSEFTAFYTYASASKTYNAFLNKGNDMVKTYLSPYSYGEVTNLVASDGVITTIPAPTQANYILSSNEVLATLSELQEQGYESYQEDFYLDPSLKGVEREKRLKEIEENIKTALITKYELSGEFEKVNALLSDSINIHYPAIIDSVSQELTRTIKRKIATPEVRGQRYAIADGTGMYRLLDYNGNLYTVSDAKRLGLISDTKTEKHTDLLPNSKYYALEEVVKNGKVRDLQPSKILLNGKELRGAELKQAISDINELNKAIVKLSPDSIKEINTILEEKKNVDIIATIEKLSKIEKSKEIEARKLKGKEIEEDEEKELDKSLEETLSRILNLATKISRYTITPFEVVLPFEARNLFGMDSSLTLQQVRERLKNNPEKLQAFEEYINKAIGTRIPASSFASLQPIRIVAFANNVNNLAVLPHEQHDISGSDTDGDTLSVEYVHIDNDGTLAEDEISTRNVRNKFKVLSNPVNFVRLMTPIDNSVLEKKAKEERAKTKDEFIDTYGFFNFFIKLDSQIKNLGILRLVGTFVKFNQIYSYYGMLIKQGKVSNKLPPIKFNGKVYDTFAFYGKNGIEVQEIINKLVNAAIDDAKYNYSGILNINQGTANFINTLLMYGINFDEILDSINKPHIKDFALVLSNYNSIDIVEPDEYYYSKKNYRYAMGDKILKEYKNNPIVAKDIKIIEEDFELFNQILDFETYIIEARNIVSLASFKTDINSTFDTIKPLIEILTGINNSSFVDLLELNIDKSIEKLRKKEKEENKKEDLLEVNTLLSDIPLFRNIIKYMKEDIANRSRFLTFFSKDALNLFKKTHTGEKNKDSYLSDKRLFSKFLDFLSQKFAIDYLNSNDYKDNKINSDIDVFTRIKEEVEKIKTAKANDEKVANFMNKYVITGDTNVDDFTAYYNRIRSSSLTDIERFKIQEAFNAISDVGEGKQFKDAFFRYALLTKGFSKSYKSLLPLVSDEYLKKLSDFAREYKPEYKKILKDKRKLSAFLDSYALFNPERAGKLFGKKKMNTKISRAYDSLTYPIYNEEKGFIETKTIPYSINYSIANKYLANPLHYNK